MTPQEELNEISINNPEVWNIFRSYLLRMASEGVIRLRRYDEYEYIDFDYGDFGERIHFDEWEIEEIFGKKAIPIDYNTFKTRIIEYLEKKKKEREEEEKRKEENEKLANEVLNMIKTCLSLDKIKGKVEFEVKSTDIAGYVTIRIEPNS
jgi:hypothetical protein